MFWFMFWTSLSCCFRVVFSKAYCFQVVGGGGGGCCVYLQNVFMYAENLLRGANNEVARDVWEFQRSPSRLLSSIVECIFIIKDKHAITSLDNYGL